MYCLCPDSPSSRKVEALTAKNSVPCAIARTFISFALEVLGGTFTFRLCSGKTVKQRADESSSAVPGLCYLTIQSPCVIWPHRESLQFAACL